MVADTADEYFDLVLDPSSGIVKTKDDLAATLDEFGVSSAVKSAFVESTKIGPKGGVVHLEYKDLVSEIGQDRFHEFLERLGMSQKMFAIFDNCTCSPHPIGQYGNCVPTSWTACITGLYGCA